MEKSIDVVDGLDEENIEGESTSGISTINSNKSLRLQNVSLVNNNDNKNKSMKWLMKTSVSMKNLKESKESGGDGATEESNRALTAIFPLIQQLVDTQKTHRDTLKAVLNELQMQRQLMQQYLPLRRRPSPRGRLNPPVR